MDPFTQRMLERARARQEKINQKLADSGQTPKRKPLSENLIKTDASPVKSPSKGLRSSISSPRKSTNESAKSNTPVKTPNRPSNDARSASSIKTPNKRSSLQKSDQLALASPQRGRNDVIVTKKEFKSPKRGSLTRRNSDVSVEINISHRNDIQIEVQVEERDAPISVVYDSQASGGSNVIIEEIEDDKSNNAYTFNMEKLTENAESKSERGGLRNNTKSQLNRLGNLYSDNPHLSSPIHRTEQEFTSATPPSAHQPASVQDPAPQGKKKFGRLAALADQINNWEDDLTHHNFNPEPTTKKTNKTTKQKLKDDESTLDVSIHSLNDINKVLQTTTKSKQTPKPINAHTFTRPAGNECHRLEKQIVAELEGEGYRRVSASQSRLVYDFSTKRADPDRQEPKCATTPSAATAPKMATMVAATPAPPVTKKPSIKKYKAPTPPAKSSDDECESDKDKENNVVPREENENDADCKQTKPEPADNKPVPDKGSPLPRKFAPKLNGNVDRSSVLSKAAMFEAGSPKARDPAEMSLRERKALFEKNKGAAIIPKAPFGLAPSVKTLYGDNKADKQAAKPLLQPKPQPKSVNTTPTSSRTNSKEEIPRTRTASKEEIKRTASKEEIKGGNKEQEIQKSRAASKEEIRRSRTASKEEIHEDAVSQSSLGGGIKGKLAALFNKEQTISELTIANKFKLEREKEMEMLNNRFQYKPQQKAAPTHNDSDDESDNEPSDKAPLMRSTASLAATKKPEIVANLPKVTFEKTKSETALNKEDKDQDKVIGSQPVKRRSSQDSPVVLAVVDDVKRIKVNNKELNGAVLQQPRLYPHLSDIDTDHSNSQEEYSDCGGSSVEEIPQSVNDKLNKSDNWAETSFGREVMNVVKKNNSSYRKAVRESDSESSACDSELDDMLDEALADDSEGPTPPKVNKNGLSSTSFVYQEKTFKSPEIVKSPDKFKTPDHFKSPLKAKPATPTGHKDKGSELVHSVSFYRRMQNAQSSAPSTPMRVVRHQSPERDTPSAPNEPATVTTVRQRIKELQNEISKQQTVISQASQALNLCAATIEFSGSTEQAEGERLLLLATHRRSASVQEMQRLQVEGAGVAATAGMASLHINSLSVPLRRDYVRQLNADGAVGHHAVCLLKCRDRVLATSMQLTRASAALLHFPDQIHMQGLASDFKVTVEVYLLQASKEVLPHDVKYHIFSKKTSSKLLTPKSKSAALKTPAVQSPAGPLAVRAAQFQPHGYCIFALPQATRKNFTLNKVPAGSPLEGTINIDIKARVRMAAPAPHAAFLTAFDDVSGLGAWHRRWFRLQTPRLAFWKYPDDVQKKMPIGDIDLSTVVSEKAVRAPRDLCARPHTILLETSVPAGLIVPDGGSLVYVRRGDGVVRRHLLAADTAPDRDMWLDRLNSALEYVRCCSTDDE